MEIPYEKVIPASLVGEINDNLSKRVVRKPCCPECYSSEIEEVKEKTKYYVDIRFEVEAKDNGKALEKTEIQISDDAIYHIANIQPRVMVKTT